MSKAPRRFAISAGRGPAAARPKASQRSCSAHSGTSPSPSALFGAYGGENLRSSIVLASSRLPPHEGHEVTWVMDCSTALAQCASHQRHGVSISSMTDSGTSVRAVRRLPATAAVLVGERTSPSTNPSPL